MTKATIERNNGMKLAKQMMSHARQALTDCPPTMVALARCWTGDAYTSISACAEEGIVLTEGAVLRYMRDPRFMDLLRRENETPGSGVWSRHQLQQWLTRVASGLESDGFERVEVWEPIEPCDADYGESEGGKQWRSKYIRVPKTAELKDRLKAADLLGKTLGAYIDKVEVSGELKMSFTDLLDDDIKLAKDVIELPSA